MMKRHENVRRSDSGTSFFCRQPASQMRIPVNSAEMAKGSAKLESFSLVGVQKNVPRKLWGKASSHLEWTFWSGLCMVTSLSTPLPQKNAKENELRCLRFFRPPRPLHAFVHGSGRPKRPTSKPTGTTGRTIHRTRAPCREGLPVMEESVWSSGWHGHERTSEAQERLRDGS